MKVDIELYKRAAQISSEELGRFFARYRGESAVGDIYKGLTATRYERGRKVVRRRKRKEREEERHL